MLKRILTICFYLICCTVSALVFIWISTSALDITYRVMNGISFDEKLYQGDLLFGIVILAAWIPEIAVGAGFGIWLAQKILHRPGRIDRAES